MPSALWTATSSGPGTELQKGEGLQSQDSADHQAGGHALNATQASWCLIQCLLRCPWLWRKGLGKRTPPRTRKSLGGQPHVTSMYATETLGLAVSPPGVRSRCPLSALQVTAAVQASMSVNPLPTALLGAFNNIRRITQSSVSCAPVLT